MRHIIRFIVSVLVLMLVGLVVPGFGRLSLVNAILAAAVISILAYLVEAIVGRRISPYGRGIIGFLSSAAVIYVAQFIVPAMQVTVLGALIAAFVIGLVDMFVPTTLR